jgi:ABC-type transport system substrate-binding protein
MYRLYEYGVPKEFPFVDRMLFKVFDGYDGIVEALIKGDVDLAWWIPPAYLSKLRKANDVTIHVTSVLEYVYLGPNLDNPVLSQEDFRQALAMLIDKHNIVHSIYLGYADVSDSIISPLHGDDYYPGVTRWSFDIEEAVNKIRGIPYMELKRADVKDQEREYWYYRGQPVSLELIVPDFDPTLVQVAQSLAFNMQKAHIAIQVKAEPMSKFVERVFVKRNFDLFVFRLPLGLCLFPDYVLWQLHSTQVAPAGWNAVGLRDKAVDDLLVGMHEANDWKTHRLLIHQLQEIVAQKCYLIPIVSPKKIDAFRSDKYHQYDVLRFYGVWPFSVRSTKGLLGDHPERPFTFAIPHDIVNTNRLLVRAEVDMIIRTFWVLGGIFFYDPTNNSALPWLCENYKVDPYIGPETEWRPGSVYRLKLRDNVKWHDGRPLQAEDIRFTFEYLKRINVQPHSLWWKCITAVRVPDAWTVELYLNHDRSWRTLPHFRSELEFSKTCFLCNCAVGSTSLAMLHPSWNERAWNKEPLEPSEIIGLGPFMWKEHKKGSYVLLERNPYFFKSPHRP